MVFLRIFSNFIIVFFSFRNYFETIIIILIIPITLIPVILPYYYINKAKKRQTQDGVDVFLYFVYYDLLMLLDRGVAWASQGEQLPLQ